MIRNHKYKYKEVLIITIAINYKYKYNQLHVVDSLRGECVCRPVWADSDRRKVQFGKRNLIRKMKHLQRSFDKTLSINS